MTADSHPTKRRKTAIRIRCDLYDFLRKLAHRDARSLSNMTEKIIQEYKEKHDV